MHKYSVFVFIIFFLKYFFQIIYDDVFHLFSVQFQLFNCEQLTAQTFPYPMCGPYSRDLMHLKSKCKNWKNLKYTLSKSHFVLIVLSWSLLLRIASFLSYIMITFQGIYYYHGLHDNKRGTVIIFISFSANKGSFIRIKTAEEVFVSLNKSRMNLTLISWIRWPSGFKIDAFITQHNSSVEFRFDSPEHKNNAHA